jgi:Flp pilus assembly protein TadB
MAHESDASIATLLRGAIDDARDLVREEIALARAELRHELSKAASAAAGFGAAGAALAVGGLFVLMAIAFGIADLFNWPTWSGFAIVGVLLAIVGIVLFAQARRAFREVRPLPRTVETVKETFQ